MKIRQQLLQLPTIESSKAEELTALIAIIENKLADGLDVTLEIEQVHTIAHKENCYDADTFRFYWKSISLEELVESMLSPEPPLIENMSYEEILWVLDHLVDDADYYWDLLEKNINYAYEIFTLMFLPDTLGYPMDLSNEEIARILFNNEIPPKAPNLPPPVIYL